MDVVRIEDLADVALQNLAPAARAARLVKVHVVVGQPPVDSVLVCRRSSTAFLLA